MRQSYDRFRNNNFCKTMRADIYLKKDVLFRSVMLSQKCYHVLTDGCVYFDKWFYTVHAFNTCVGKITIHIFIV